ncbi:MAG: DinB family protein, partial [Chitinophagales bacterium]
ERYQLATFSGHEVKQTSHELFRDHKGIQDGITYPPLAEFKKDWEKISPLLRDSLLNLTEDQLNGPDPYGMPGKDLAFFDSITGCTDRESYCLGQIGLYRRLLGYEAMKYE